MGGDLQLCAHGRQGVPQYVDHHLVFLAGFRRGHQPGDQLLVGMGIATAGHRPRQRVAGHPVAVPADEQLRTGPYESVNRIHHAGRIESHEPGEHVADNEWSVGGDVDPSSEDHLVKVAGRNATDGRADDRLPIGVREGGREGELVRGLGRGG